ncbi:MAG: alpha/beta fold hydrolase [Fimbriimonadaceae bacterium]|nr:alpha/beta fold hydrolase [Fimbriimonadaceae bacterium]QYK55266.1 MAG: alpha/beta fold hydrolase [Fimbriimonadaceae bacterium]
MARWTVPVRDSEVPVMAEGDGSTVVVLAHGAGSHMEHKTMEWLAGLVRQTGASVARFNFLYRACGRPLPDRMPLLVQTYRAVVDSVRGQLSPKRLVVGGHSMGGRVASVMESEARTADGLLLFAYPLHPPGQPEKLRDAHLASIQTPTLQFSGTRDEFCTRGLMEAVHQRLDAQTWRLHWIEGADHSYSVGRASGRTRKDVEAEIVEALTGFGSGAGLW